MTPTTTEQATKAPAFQKSPDTILIAKRLKSLAQGEFVSYATLNAIVPGRSLAGQDRHILDSARNDALEDKVVTACVTGEGLKRLTDDEIAELPADAMAHIRRKARRALGKSVCADTEKMTNGHKKDWLIGMSLLGAVSQCAKKSTRNAVEAAVTATGNRLGYGDIATLFNSKA